WWEKIEIARRIPPRVDAIQIAELDRVNPAVVERYITQQPGEPLDTARLNRDLLRVYGDGYYEKVDYSLLSQRERNILRVMPMEKSWGPDYLRLAINLDTTLEHGSSYVLRGAYHKTWMNALGGEMIASAEIGTKTGVGLEFYQPLDASQRFFVEPVVTHVRSTSNIYQNDHKISEYNITDTSSSLAFGANVGLLGQLRLGWRDTYREANLETGSQFMPDASNHTGGWFGNMDFDQMDRIYLPTKGWASKLAYFSSEGNHYDKISIDLRGTYPLGGLIFGGGAAYTGSPQGHLPLYDAGTLGGFLNLSAFANGQLIGDDIALGQIRVEKIIGQMPMGLRGDLRVGMALEAGKVDKPYSETERTGWLDSKTLYIGGETPLGPVFLGYGWSGQGASNLYLFMGVP
ncbi:MAG: BamA/TamA family outer membrane protein, partial [Pseudomonadota bacterium]